MIKKIPVEKAVGYVIPHDLTKIVPGEYKGPFFRKGHLIVPEDIPHLLDAGKTHLNLISLGPNEIHEDEAITRLAQAVAGANITSDAPKEGRINLRSNIRGLLKINKKTLEALNSIPNAVVSTLHNNELVEARQIVAAVKVVPLVVKKSLVERAENLTQKNESVVAVKPLQKMKLGTVIVASEVFYGRIEDRFAPVLRKKAEHYNLEMVGESVAPDDLKIIKNEILAKIEIGAQIVIAAGGMSVDADDLTPSAIRATGAKVVTYGSPVLPGGMFMLAYLNGIPIIGLPACGMSAQNTILDLIMPRLLAGEILTKKDFTVLGYGGLCRSSCPECTFPVCSFGKN